VQESGPTVLATLDPFKPVSAMTGDATTLFWADGAEVHALPKAGGPQRTVVAPDPTWTADIPAIAVDDVYVYFLEDGSLGRLSRVPKNGGPREVLVNDLDYPTQIALDDTYVYVAVTGTFTDFPPAGIATGQILRMRKAGGGPYEVLADHQQLPTAIVVDGDLVYYSTCENDDGTNGGIWALPKAGGTPLALTETGIKNVGPMVALGDGIYFVDHDARSLMRVPKSGGDRVDVGGGSLEWPLATAGSSLFVAMLAPGSVHPSVLAFDANGDVTATVASWSMPAVSATGEDIAARVIYADDARVYWVDAYYGDGSGSTPPPTRNPITLAGGGAGRPGRARPPRRRGPDAAEGRRIRHRGD
jgi:hypothetical protein